MDFEIYGHCSSDSIRVCQDLFLYTLPAACFLARDGKRYVYDWQRLSAHQIRDCCKSFVHDLWISMYKASKRLRMSRYSIHGPCLSVQGSTIFKDRVADENDPAIDILEQNGAIIVGKTNLPEFGAGANTYNKYESKKSMTMAFWMHALRPVVCHLTAIGLHCPFSLSLGFVYCLQCGIRREVFVSTESCIVVYGHSNATLKALAF